MKNAPIVFDRPAIQMHRQRARNSDHFLQKLAIAEIEDRLSMVNRTFTAAAVVTGFPELWKNAFPNAQMVADSEVLDLNVNSFDLVIHAMCLHWSNDPVGQIIQCRRALKPDGLFLAVLLGGQTLSELRASLAEAESKLTGGLSPRVAPMAEIRELGALLQRAGLALPVADNATSVAEYHNLMHLMHDLRCMGENNALSGRLRRPTKRSIFKSAELIYQNRFGTPQGRLPASFELVCLTGWAPDETQQKPLRPGSAQARLADALKTTESKLPD